MHEDHTIAQDDQLSGPNAAADISTRTAMLIIAATVLALFLPLFYLGIPDGFDLMQHMRFADAYRLAIMNGEFIPKWAGADNFGFGSIGIRYYPPLPYAVMSVSRILTGDWYTSFWITALAWIMAGCMGMYLWIKESSSNLAALSAALAYAIMPFHTFEIYQAVLYSEFAAAGLMPFCFLFLTRLCRRRQWSDVIAFSAAYSLLILAHIPTGIIGTAGMAVYALVLIEWRRIGEMTVKVAAAVGIVLCSSIFHIAKVIPEIEWVQHNSSRYFARGFYDYKSYLFPIFFSAPEARYVEKLLWHFDAIILITLIFFAASLITFLVSRGSAEANALRSRVGVGLLATGGLAIFMLSVSSLNVWNSVSLLQKIQFPWRWLALASIATAALFGLSIPLLLFKRGKFRRWVAYPVTALILAALAYNVSQNIIPSTPLSRAQFQEKIDGMYDEEACDCWWPIWAKREALDQRRLTIDGRSAEVTYLHEEQRTISVSDGDAGVLRVPTFYHPYWTAAVNGLAQPVEKDENGSILIPVGSGPQKVELSFNEPWYIAWASYVSLATWLLIFAFGISHVFRRRPRDGPPAEAGV
jgi:hypothetical protein